MGSGRQTTETDRERETETERGLVTRSLGAAQESRTITRVCSWLRASAGGLGAPGQVAAQHQPPYEAQGHRDFLVPSKPSNDTPPTKQESPAPVRTQAWTQPQKVPEVGSAIRFASTGSGVHLSAPPWEAGAQPSPRV